MIEKIREALMGKKTYLIAAAAIIASLIAFSEGADVSTTVQQIITAILAVTIRAGITKNV